MSTNKLIQSLIIVSEQSANIARICRQDECLLSLLTQEKKDHEKHPRILHDFKTLVDVLVQQLIKFELEKQFLDLKDRVYGEENNTFVNAEGNEIVVQISEDKSTNINLLTEFLNVKMEAATLLVDQIHSTVTLDKVCVDLLPTNCPDIPIDELAVWIDPIDATSEYIGGFVEDSNLVVPSKGLSCVAVLIGVFHKSSGVPLIGVINQPFFERSGTAWKGRCFWGLSYKGYNIFSTPPITSEVIFNMNKVIAVSNFEDVATKMKLEKSGFKLSTLSGAGYKLLCVILGVVDAYVLSKDSTYYWDTCACHAILKALGGGLWNYRISVQSGQLVEVSYLKSLTSGLQQCCIEGGLIATKDINFAKELINILK